MDDRWAPLPVEKLKNLDRIKELLPQQSPEDEDRSNFYKSWMLGENCDVEEDVEMTVLDTSEIVGNAEDPKSDLIDFTGLFQKSPSDEDFEESLLEKIESWDGGFVEGPNQRFIVEMIKYLVNNQDKNGQFETFTGEIIFQKFDLSLCSKEEVSELLLLVEVMESAVTKGVIVKELKSLKPDDFVRTKTIQMLTEKVVKPENKVQILKTFTEKELDDTKLNFLDNLVFKCGYADSLIDSHFNETLKSLRESTAKNSKVGTFLVGIIKKLPTEIPTNLYQDLKQMVESHKSFLKSAALSELRKRKGV